MKKTFILLVFFIIISFNAFAANSTNYQLELGIICGEENSNSSNYSLNYYTIGGGGNSSSNNYSSEYIIEISSTGAIIESSETQNETGTNQEEEVL